MPFVRMPGLTGKVYVPEEQTREEKKHNCKDCYSCQMCSDDRCQLCQGKTCEVLKTSQVSCTSSAEILLCHPFRHPHGQGREKGDDQQINDQNG